MLSDTDGNTRTGDADYPPKDHQMHGWKVNRPGRPGDQQLHKAVRRRLVVALKQDAATRKVHRGPRAHVGKALSDEKLPLEL